MQSNAQKPSHIPIKHRTFILIIAATIAIIAALVAAFFLLLGSGTTPYPVRATMIPGAQMRTLQSPQAMRYDLSTADQAQAYFRAPAGQRIHRPARRRHRTAAGH